MSWVEKMRKRGVCIILACAVLSTSVVKAKTPTSGVTFVPEAAYTAYAILGGVTVGGIFYYANVAAPKLKELIFDFRGFPARRLT